MDGYLPGRGGEYASSSRYVAQAAQNEDRANVRTRQGSSTASRLEEVVDKRMR